MVLSRYSLLTSLTDRCSNIETINISFLETLSLKTVIYVGTQEPSKLFQEFFDRWSIQWFVIKTSDVSSTMSPTNSPNESSIDYPIHRKSTSDSEYNLNDNDDLMIIKSRSLRRIIKMLLQTQNYNVLLVDKSSIVIGILRKIQKWNISSVINEYRFFSGKNRNYFAETFLELVNLKIIQEDDQTESGISSPNIQDNEQNVSIGHNSSSQRLVDESYLVAPPQLPYHILRIIETIKESGLQSKQSDALIMKQIPSNLGIFGNKYRLSFNKRERGDYEFYKASNKNLIKIIIPTESMLPSWFNFQRDLWEQENVQEHHNFYKESIFI